MDDQQPYKSSEKTFDLEEIIKRLESPTKKLGDLLNEMTEKAQKKVNLSGIERSVTTIDLHNEKIDDKLRWKYLIGTFIYNDKGNAASVCYANPIYSPYKIKCVFRGEEFVLFDSPQSISFIENIKDSILKMHNILYPEVLENLDKQNIYIGTAAYMYLNNPIKENPEIRIDSNRFSYDNGRFNIKTTWVFYDPSEL